MKSDTDLDLVFKNAIGKKVTLNIEEPKKGVTKAEIDAAMQTVVEIQFYRRRPGGSRGRLSSHRHPGRGG